MSKIGIIIDPHVTDRHRCRVDNFLETVLKKLDYVASKNDYVIICGDLFHTNTNSHLVFNKVYKLLMKHKGKFITIPGNHDLLHNNLRCHIRAYYLDDVHFFRHNQISEKAKLHHNRLNLLYM